RSTPAEPDGSATSATRRWSTPARWWPWREARCATAGSTSSLLAGPVRPAPAGCLLEPLHRSGRVPRHQPPRLHVPGDHGVRTHEGLVAHRDALGQGGLGPDPHVATDGDRGRLARVVHVLVHPGADV